MGTTSKGAMGAAPPPRKKKYCCPRQAGRSVTVGQIIPSKRLSMRRVTAEKLSPFKPNVYSANALLFLLLFAACGQEAVGRKFEVFSSCYAGNTSMPLWAKKNVNRCRRIFETTVKNDNIIHDTVRGGEYKFYHFTLDNFEDVNRAGGVKIRVEAAPCHGSVQLFVKPGLNFNGEPMNQMFETMPNSSGVRSPTWPFPDNNTGTHEQGPEAHMVEDGWEYPGPMFRLMKWGDKSKEYGLPNVITMKVLHGSYFIGMTLNRVIFTTTSHLV